MVDSRGSTALRILAEDFIVSDILIRNVELRTRSTLAGNWNDCLLRLALNVNQTGLAWVLDKLRFSH